MTIPTIVRYPHPTLPIRHAFWLVGGELVCWQEPHSVSAENAAARGLGLPPFLPTRGLLAHLTEAQILSDIALAESNEIMGGEG